VVEAEISTQHGVIIVVFVDRWAAVLRGVCGDYGGHHLDVVTGRMMNRVGERRCEVA